MVPRAQWLWCALAVLGRAAAFTVDCNPQLTDCRMQLSKLESDDTDLGKSSATSTNETIQTTPKISLIAAQDNATELMEALKPKSRLLNLTPDELHSIDKSKKESTKDKKSYLDLSDVSLDDEDEKRKDSDKVEVKTKKPDEKIESENFYSNLNSQFHDLLSMDKESEETSNHCTEDGITFSIGEKMDRGCDETCECGLNGFECMPRCKHPYVKQGRRLADPLCFESPVDDCCSIIACATGNGQDPKIPNAKTEACRHNNETHAVGVKWFIGCEEVCVCERNNAVTCKPRCPQLPPSDKCINVQDPNDSCCEVQVCDVSQDVHEDHIDNATSSTTTSRSADRTTIDFDDILAEITEKSLKSTMRPLVLLEPITSVKVLPNNSVQVNLLHHNNSRDPIHLLLSSDGEKTFKNIEFEHSNLLPPLKEGNYVIKTKETETKFNFTIVAPIKISVTEKPKLVANMEKIGCYQDGVLYPVGEEFHIGCSELCECTGNNTQECSPLLCPNHVGLELVSRGCVQWAPSPPAEPPNCCPRTARCLSDGTCHYKGEDIPNWTEVPISLSGCEQRCFCENGELDCQEVCTPLSPVPPQSLRCPPLHRPAPVNISDDDCCKQWGCLPNPNAFKNTIIMSKYSTRQDYEVVTPQPRATDYPTILINSKKGTDFVSTIDLDQKDSTTLLAPTTPYSKFFIHNFMESTKSPDQDRIFNNAAFDETHSIFEKVMVTKLNSDNWYIAPPKMVPVINVPHMPVLVDTSFQSKNVRIQPAPLATIRPNNVSNRNETSENESNNKPENNLSKELSRSSNQDKLTCLNMPLKIYFSNNTLHDNSIVKLKNDLIDFLKQRGMADEFLDVLKESDEDSPAKDTYIEENITDLEEENDALVIISDKLKNDSNTLNSLINDSETVSGMHKNLERSAKPTDLYGKSKIPANAVPPGFPSKKPLSPAFLPTLPPGIFPAEDIPDYDQNNIHRPEKPLNPLIPTIPPIPQRPNYGDENKKLSVISLLADSPTSVKMLFGLPPLLVGLSGSVDLRYTDNPDIDISEWQTQVFAPADQILSTARLEFRLTGLKPSTIYHVKGKLYLHSLSIQPESDVYSIRTLDLPVVEEKRRQIDSKLTVMEVNDTAALVTWRHFSEAELLLIDGIQVRYRPVGTPIYLMTELLHHSRSNAELHDLRPDSRYEASLVLVPPPKSVTELFDPTSVEFTTSPYIDPYNWSVVIEAQAIGSSAAELVWRGIPPPAERWVRVYRAAHECGAGRAREHDAFKLAARDEPPVITLTGLEPNTRCRVWLELFLTNGKVKTSNVLEVTTKLLEAPESIDNVIEASSIGSAGNRGDYYGALVVVGVIAALGAVTSLLLLLIVVRRHRPRSCPITPVPTAPRESSLPPYDNPAYKLELQQETMDL